MIPRLIHSMHIFVAKLNLELADDDWDDDFHSNEEGTGLEWEADESKWLRFRTQKRNDKFRYYDKRKGGWTRDNKMSFWVYARDILDAEGKYKLDRGDKIVRLQDLAGQAMQGFSDGLFVRDLLFHGEYRKVHLVELMCEDQSATL